MTHTLLVLAAGIGSRYGGLKQIDPVGPNGEIIIDYSIYDAIFAGFKKIVFIIRKDIEKDFKTVISSKYENKIHIEYVFQELEAVPPQFKIPAERKKPWGTGHAILAAKNLVKESFAVINADDFYGRSGYLALKNSFDAIKNPDKSNDYFLVGFELKKTLSEHGTVSRGICDVNQDGYLKKIIERTKITKELAGIFYWEKDGKKIQLKGEETASMNMWGFTPSIFEKLEILFEDFLRREGKAEKSEFFIPTTVDSMINNGSAKVKVLRSSDEWFGITYKEDKEMVKNKVLRLLEKNIYPKKLF